MCVCACACVCACVRACVCVCVVEISIGTYQQQLGTSGCMRMLKALIRMTEFMNVYMYVGM